MKKILIMIFLLYKSIRKVMVILRYKLGGRIPWSLGYFDYKWQEIQHVIHDQKLMESFKQNILLPDAFGVGIDERIVEYPWLLAHMPSRQASLLDAGSILNFEPVIIHPKLANKKISIVTLAPESNSFWKRSVEYLFRDMRQLPFQDNVFDFVSCISTLEHVGMDNAMIYAGQEYKESKNDDYVLALLEMKRVLKAGGKLFLTVPFGVYENFGFFQQFDSAMWQKVKDTLGSDYREYFYGYGRNGWQRTTEETSRDALYFDVRNNKNESSDNAAAARAVACLIYKKDV